MADEPAAPVAPAPGDAAPAPIATPVAPDAPPSILTPELAAEPAKTEAPAAPVVPEAYEFAAPEVDGKPVEVDTVALDALRTVAKDAGLTQEQFQALGAKGGEIIASRLAAAQEAGLAANVAAFNTTIVDWGNQVKADAEMGGDKLPVTLANVSKAIDTFGDAQTRDALILTGAGNHPAVIRFLSKIGSLAGDPTGLTSGKPAGAAKARSGEQAARDMYNSAGGNYADVTA